MSELENMINNYEYNARLFLKSLSIDDLTNLELTNLDFDNDSISKIINFIIKSSLDVETRGKLLEYNRTSRGPVDIQKVLETDYNNRLISLNKVLSCEPLQVLIRVQEKLSYKEDKQKVR